MIEWLYHVDVALLLFCNGTIANPALDRVMPFLTDVRNWYSAYLLGAFCLVMFGGKHGRITLLLLLVTILISDQLSSGVMKELFCRPRPFHDLDHMRLIYGTAGGFSFPSSHAVNNFAFATVLSLNYPKFSVPLYIFAFLVAFSRVYLGLHYPSDMLAGMILGIMVGWIVWSLHGYGMVGFNKIKIWRRGGR